MVKEKYMSTIDEKLVEVISATPINTIDDVIKVMEGMDDILQNDDGLKWFNLLYLRVSQSIQSDPPAEGWENPPFVERLAVVFAGLYFTAVAAWQRDQKSVSRAWKPLFELRNREGVFRVQFAIAGMNAHINHDLCIALVQTSEEFAIVPRRATPEHRDFEKVNSILERVADEVKQFLATGIVGEVDQDLGRLDDAVALWSVRNARETAWTNSEILWQIKEFSLLSDGFLKNLDRLVGLTTRGLLTPVLFQP
jgi:hypothetical protein